MDTGDNGLTADVFSMNEISTGSFMDTIDVSQSFKLYLGSIDSDSLGLPDPLGRQSAILMRFSSEKIRETALCTDTTTLKSLKVSIVTSSQMEVLPAEQITYETNGQALAREAATSATVNAWFISEIDSILPWDESVFIKIDEEDNIYLNDELIMNSSDLQGEKIYLDNSTYKLNFHLDSLSVGLIEQLCSSYNDFGIWLEETEGDRLTEFYSTTFYSSSIIPGINAIVDEDQTTSEELPKYEIESINSQHFTESFYTTQLDSEEPLYGMIISQHVPDPLAEIDFPSAFTVEDTAIKLDIFSLIIDTLTIPEDSSGIITFKFHDISFFRLDHTIGDYDPAEDNWDPTDSSGTENNGLYDFGELYFDCGLDLICDENEAGYNPDGTENNYFWDEGEIFKDCGLDSLCDVFEDGYDVETNPDPSGDNYLPDPSMDDWNEEDSTGTEGNGKYDLGEIFQDIGFDWIPDSILVDTTEYENNGIWDWNDIGNGIWDNAEAFIDIGNGLWNVDEQCLTELCENCSSWGESGCIGILIPQTDFIDIGDAIWNAGEYFDDENSNGVWDDAEYFDDENGNNIWDLTEGFTDIGNGIWNYGEDHEPWVDAGTDGLWNHYESGFNPYGKEGNDTYDYGELFEDCGIDTVCNLEEENYSESNPDPQQDDLYLDPAGDNWNIEDSTNTEKNNLFDWEDLNGNGVFDLSDSYEEFKDWGIDQIPDSLTLIINPDIITDGSIIYDTIYTAPEAANYTGEYLNEFLGTNAWVFDLTSQNDTTYEKPELAESDDLTLWPSAIQNINGKYEITISLWTKSPISGFEFILDHTPYYKLTTEIVQKNLFITNQSDEENFSEKLIQDISIYPVNNQYDQTDMQSEFIMTYGDGIYSNLNIQPMGVFLQEHQGVVISDALLHLKVDTTHQHYYVHPNGIKIILNRLNQHFDGTGDPDMMPLQSLVVKDELDVNFSLKNEIQYYLEGEKEYHGYILSASEESFNFSVLTFYTNEDTLHNPEFEVLWIE